MGSETHPDILAVIEGRSQWCVVTGDCLQILPTIPAGSVGAVVTDPPYGIGRDGSRWSSGSHGGRKAYEFKGWDSAPPIGSVFGEIFRVSKHQCIWGGNYFAEYLPPKMGWLVWDKGQDICGSDCELAFTSRDEALRRKVLNRVSIAQDGAVHPTQKPVELMAWCLSFVPPDALILDPFTGSGTTGVAAIQTGRRFIGIEISEDYANIARRRISEAAPLFVRHPEREPDPVLFPTPVVPKCESYGS